MLKWHREGCFATAFATALAGGIEGRVVDGATNAMAGAGDGDGDGDLGGDRSSIALVEKTLSVAERRDRKAMVTHWLAAGSKDGKVSLWDIY